MNGILGTGHSRLRMNSTDKEHRPSKQPALSSSSNDNDCDEWEISCICGVKEDNDEEMVLCDQCLLRWEHVGCIYPKTKKRPSGIYFCHVCNPRPTELSREQARAYQDRVKMQKEELKRKLAERARRKEENSSKPSSVVRIRSTLKASVITSEKSGNSSYREILKNEYSTNARRLLSISRLPFNNSSGVDIVNTLRNNPIIRSLYVETKVYGIVVTEEVSEGAYIAELLGYVSLQKECGNRHLVPGSLNDHTFLFEMDQDKIIIDARECGNMQTKYLRRSCHPNAELEAIKCGSDVHFMIKATQRLGQHDEVSIKLEEGWMDKPRPAQGCGCDKIKEENKCELERHFKQTNNNASSSRKSLPANGVTRKVARSRIPQMSGAIASDDSVMIRSKSRLTQTMNSQIRNNIVKEPNHGRLPRHQVDVTETNYREVNVDQLSESDFEGMKDSGLAYGDHDYIGANPNAKVAPETSQFPVLGGVTDQYLNGETNDPCSERTDNRMPGMSISGSVVKKPQDPSALRTVKSDDYGTGAARHTYLQPKPYKDVTQPKKSGRPSKNETRELAGERLMARAMVKAGMQGLHVSMQPQQLIHVQGMHPIQDHSVNFRGAAPIVTPARGQKIIPRGRPTIGLRRNNDEGTSGYTMMSTQQGIPPSKPIPTKKTAHFGSVQDSAQDAHSREMMQAAQNALAPSNAMISGMRVHPPLPSHPSLPHLHTHPSPNHSIVLPPHNRPRASSHRYNDGDLPRTPGKLHAYTPISSPHSTVHGRTVSHEMNIQLIQEPIRTNSDGLPGGGCKTPLSSRTPPLSRMSISESTGSQTTSPQLPIMSGAIASDDSEIELPVVKNAKRKVIIDSDSAESADEQQTEKRMRVGEGEERQESISEPPPSTDRPSAEVDKLREALAKSQDMYQRACREAKKQQDRAERAETLLDTKPPREIADWKGLETELEKRLADITTQLEESRKKVGDGQAKEEDLTRENDALKIELVRSKNREEVTSRAVNDDAAKEIATLKKSMDTLRRLEEIANEKNDVLTRENLLLKEALAEKSKENAKKRD